MMPMPNSEPDVALPKARSYSGIPAHERTRMRREKLLEAAMDLFGEVGYARTTMRNICVKARLAERYFYESFASTKEVFDAVYQGEVQKLMQAINDALAASPMKDRRFIEAGLRAFLQFMEADPRRVQILLIDGVWMDEMKFRDGNSDLLGYRRLIQSLTRGFHPDLNPEIDVEMAASGIIGLVIHTVIDWSRRDFAADVESVLQHTMYAWGGLGFWAKNKKTLAASPAVDRQERVERVLKAFKDDAGSDGQG
jgi:AcrR family transcriptional regulator